MKGGGVGRWDVAVVVLERKRVYGYMYGVLFAYVVFKLYMCGVI